MTAYILADTLFIFFLNLGSLRFLYLWRMIFSYIQNRMNLQTSHVIRESNDSKLVNVQRGRPIKWATYLHNLHIMRLNIVILTQSMIFS